MAVSRSHPPDPGSRVPAVPIAPNAASPPAPRAPGSGAFAFALSRPGFSPAPLYAFLLLGLALAAGLLSGCSERNTAEAEAGEMRLTKDIGWNGRPFFVDDATVAFSSRAEDLDGTFRLCTVPRAGGEIDVLTPDTISVVGIAPLPDGGGFVAVDLHDSRIRLVGADGTPLHLYPERPRTRLLDVSRRGDRFLYGIFRGDNYDVGVYDLVRDTLIAAGETAYWEEDACFGPGPDGITVVQRESFGAPTNRLAVRRGPGEEFRPLPFETGSYKTPTWSPDGRFLAFASDRFGSLDLWVMEATTQELVQITAGSEDDVFPGWSPDGRWLCFARRTTTSHIKVGDPVTRASRQITEGPARDYAPRPSPDGEWIAFVRETRRDGTGPGEPDLCVVPADGDEEDVVSLGIRGLQGGEEMVMVWSPDGEQLAFSARDAGGDIDIYRVARAGGDPVRVTVQQGEELMPVWSPDGRWIGYTRPAAGETQVWAVPAEGGVPVQISTDDAVNQDVTWAPDSRNLAYFSLLPDGDIEIRLANIERPGEHRVLHRTDEVMVPLAWTEDSSVLLAWHRQGNEYAVRALPLDGSPGFEVARPAGSESPDRHFLEFTERGRAFRGDLYPEGVHAFADGESVSDIFVLRVGELLRRTFPTAFGKEAS